MEWAQSLGNLLQSGLHGSECSVQIDADALDDGNNRNRNPRCDEPVFNSRGPGFIFKKELMRRRIIVDSGWLISIARGNTCTELPTARRPRYNFR
jgi:hypothetical protein